MIYILGFQYFYPLDDCTEGESIPQCHFKRDATNNFDTSTIVDKGSYGQMYIDELKDGSLVAIRCLNMNKMHNKQSLMNHIEIISKLRHQHLISAIRHCFDYCLDDSSVNRIFILFEYVPNGTLMDWIFEKSDKQTLTWSQRIAAAIGVAKGIQFLHTGIMAGIFSTRLKLTDILQDLNFVAKISNHNLPLLTEYVGKVGSQIPSIGSKEVDNARIKYQEKSDIYDLGVIILEIMVGKHLNENNEVDIFRHQLEASTTADIAARNSMVDPAVQDSYSDESLKTVMQICSKCLLENPDDRPSIKDMMWNLQSSSSGLLSEL